MGLRDRIRRTPRDEKRKDWRHNERPSKPRAAVTPWMRAEQVKGQTDAHR